MNLLNFKSENYDNYQVWVVEIQNLEKRKKKIEKRNREEKVGGKRFEEVY